MSKIIILLPFVIVTFLLQLKVNEKMQDLRPYSGHSVLKIILLPDNARPHIPSFTKNTIQKFCWEVLPHPACKRCTKFLLPSFNVTRSF